MFNMKLKTRSVARQLFHALPLNTSQNLKLKNFLYGSFGFLIKNTEMYRAWKRTNAISRIDEIYLPRSDESYENACQQYINSGYKYSSHRSQGFVNEAESDYNFAEDDIRLIAFYLPQFHPIPENDRWWGKGFTEWTNVTKAVPQFVGHHQPQLPIDVGFYDLRLVKVMERQIELAKKYGVFGFCFHHYWFGGKRLLEKPVDNFLSDKNIDFPFCLCWANENWTRRWDGQESDVLMAQNHSPADDLAFIKDLARYLTDKRYIKINNKPLIIVYRPQILPNAPETAERWRDYCRKAGIGEIFLVGAKTFGLQDPTQFGFDAAVEFPPHIMYSGIITDKVQILNPSFDGIVYDYEMHVQSKEYLTESPCLTFKTVAPGWDNTARKPDGGHIFYGSNPRLYSEWLTNVIRYTKDNHDKDNQIVFINAWNEWAEGAHLEPDRRYGYGYLQATRNALENSRSKLNSERLRVRDLDNMDRSVSIVAPAYNHAKYIENCILSLANQSYPYMELIIIDDCSTDDTVDKIKGLIANREIQSRFSGGVTFIQHYDNRGASYSINEGLKIATGAYLTIINTDDLYESNRLDEMMKNLIRKNGQLAYSRVQTIDDNGDVYHGEEGQYYEMLQEGLENRSEILTTLLNHNVAISTGNLLFTRELYHQVGGFKEYKYIHDWDFVLHSTLLDEPVYVESTSYLYRLHETNSFKELKRDEIATNEEVRRVLGNIYKQLVSKNFTNENIPQLRELDKIISDPMFRECLTQHQGLK